MFMSVANVLSNRRFRLSALAGLLLGILSADIAAAQPKLAVVIVVDQMRADFLTEFAEDFDGGFARLTRDGAVFAGAYHDHALTATAPGHATIATGTYPSRHGVIGNQIWSYERDGLRNIVLDDNVATAWSEGHFDRIGEGVDALHDFAAS